MSGQGGRGGGHAVHGESMVTGPTSPGRMVGPGHGLLQWRGRHRHLEPVFLVFTMYVHGIYHVYVDHLHIHGIYVVYSWIYHVHPWRWIYHRTGVHRSTRGSRLAGLPARLGRPGSEPGGGPQRHRSAAGLAVPRESSGPPDGAWSRGGLVTGWDKRPGAATPPARGRRILPHAGGLGSGPGGGQAWGASMRVAEGGTVAQAWDRILPALPRGSASVVTTTLCGRVRWDSGASRRTGIASGAPCARARSRLGRGHPAVDCAHRAMQSIHGSPKLEIEVCRIPAAGGIGGSACQDPRRLSRGGDRAHEATALPSTPNPAPVQERVLPD